MPFSVSIAEPRGGGRDRVKDSFLIVARSRAGDTGAIGRFANQTKITHRNHLLTHRDRPGIPTQMRSLYFYFHSCRLAIAASLLFLASGAPVSAEISFEETRTYFEGLRQRRLFTVAETVCLRKLNDRSLNLAERSWYSVELSRTFAAHAAFASSLDEERELLDRARRIPEALLEKTPDHPQRPLLLAQSLFVSAGEVETLRLRLELTPFSDELRKRALSLAEATIPALEKLETQLGAELRDPSRDLLGEKLKPFQLRGLQRTTRFRLALLLLDKSLLLPSTSPDRAEALSKSDELFRRLAAGEPGVLVTWQSQLGLLRVNRLRGDLEAVSRMINAIEKDEPPAEILDEVIAEKVELLHRERKYASALEELRVRRETRHQLTGRLTWLMARTMLELWTLARDRSEPELAKSLMQDASHFVALAQSDPGGFWGERCRLLLSTATATRNYGPIVAPLIQKAQIKFAEGKTSDATQLYGEAFLIVQNQTPADPETTAELGYTFASLLLKSEQPAQAAQIFGAVVTANPKGARAAEADLFRAYCLGVVYRDKPVKESREAYTTALISHRTQFVDSPTSHDATWYLAQLEERRLQTTAALQLYQTIPLSHPRGEEAQVAFARCSESILKRLRQLKKPATEWEAAINGWLVSVTKPMLAPTELLSTTQAELLLHGARIRLTLTQPDFAAANVLLDRVLTARPPEFGPKFDADAVARYTVSAEQLAMANQLRIVSLAGAGRVGEAAAILNRASSRGPEELLILLDGLSAATAGQTDAVKKSLGELQVDVTRRSRVDITTLPKDQRMPFLLRIAEASELAGRTREAADTYAHLLKEQPDDLSVRKCLARLRSQLASRDDQLRAKRHWQKIEGRYKAGSDPWMESRLEIIRCHIRLGENDDANKLLTVTQLLYRNAGTPEIRQQFSLAARQLSEAAKK
jgi:TolA-binding protein